MERTTRRVLLAMTGVDRAIWSEIAMLPLGVVGLGLLMSISIRFLPFQDPLDALDRAHLFSGVLLVLSGFPLAWLCFTKSSRSPTSRVLRSYIYGAIAFAGVYFGVYHVNPNSFSFATGISTPAAFERARAISDDVDRYSRQALALGELFEWIKSMAPGQFRDFAARRKNTRWQLPSGRHVEFTTRAIGGGGAVAIQYGVVISDGFGEIELFRGDALLHHSPHHVIVEESDVSQPDFLTAILELKQSTDSEADARIQELSASIPLQFYQADFLYFSFVTVTTLGYGDIVPNHTLVRLLVVAQIVLGLSLVLAASRQSTLDS